MSKRSSARTYLARWTKRSTPTQSPTRFGNGLKPAIAHVCRNLTHRPDHTLARIIRWTPVTAHSLGSRNRGTLQRGLHQQTLTIARFNRLDSRNPATRYDLDHPARDRRHEAQRPQASAAVPLGGHAFAPKPRSDYRKRATPPPTRSRHPPVHTILDPDSSDAEARPQWSYSPRSPPRKAPRRAEDTLPGYRQRSALGFPESPHGYYESKQPSACPSEPQPSTSRDQTYAWPPAPRDFDIDRAESLASTEDEPDCSFAAVTDMTSRNRRPQPRPALQLPSTR